MTPEQEKDRLIIEVKNILPRIDYQLLDETAKACAAICVKEIIKEIGDLPVGITVMNYQYAKQKDDHWNKVLELLTK